MTLLPSSFHIPARPLWCHGHSPGTFSCAKNGLNYARLIALSVRG
jgi:hypothetical protein